MTKHTNRPHGRREQAKVLRRKRATAPRRRAEFLRTLAMKAAERVVVAHRSAGLKEIGAELHEPRIMTDDTRNRRRGRRASR